MSNSACARWILAFWCGMLLLVGCARTPPPLPPKPVYVLSGQFANHQSYNGLTIVDSETWQIHHQVALPRSKAHNLNRDPQGRLWIGFGGVVGNYDDRVRVYAPDGALIQEFHSCNTPIAGITFAVGQAFVACLDSGFRGQVAVIDLETLEETHTLDLEGGDDHFLLAASATNGEIVVVSAATDGPREEESYTDLVMLDPDSLTILGSALSEAGGYGDILPHDGHFYLLNAGNWADLSEPDIVVLEPGNPPTLTSLSLATAPVWGDIVGDELYTYHEVKTAVVDFNPTCMVGRLNLTTGVTETWELPDGWRAGDLAVVNGEVLLARMWGNEDEDGLYRFDPASGAVTLLVNIPDASSILGGE